MQCVTLHAFRIFLCLWVTLTVSSASAKGNTAQDTVQELKNLEQRVTKLEQESTSKAILRPVKDAKFLYQAVIGNDAHAFQRNGGICASKSPMSPQITLIKATILGKFKARLKGSDDEIPLPQGLSIECPLQAVEEVLGLEPAPDADIISRIENAYDKINYGKLQRSRVRLGVGLARIDTIDALSLSFMVHTYPAYRRHIPGRLDPLRRISFYFGIGGANGAPDTTDIANAVFSAGIAFDLTDGITLTIGTTLFEEKDPLTGDGKRRTEGTFGVSVTSDLWKRLGSK
jgi:hypothetical protein